MSLIQIALFIVTLLYSPLGTEILARLIYWIWPLSK